MQTIDIARRCAELNAVKDASSAYVLALHQGGLSPEERLEAAVYLLRMGGDYKVAYTQLVRLYQEEQFRAECLDIITNAFYTPNVKLMKSRYEKNCAALAKYPYLFRRDFPQFGDLPLRFYPFDDNGYLPFDTQRQAFSGYVDYNNQVVGRNFFHDLENPILAKDVYSQYELEYLYDNVRPSEDVGRENHLYLHYESWETFCAHLQVLNVRQILGAKKVVFLFGDELSLYPIDFKEKYGIDYSQYPVKQITFQDIQRLIWHTQLSSDNGGDFFNEVFDNHPNLISLPSLMFDSVEEAVANVKDEITCQANGKGKVMPILGKSLTDKDILLFAILRTQSGYLGGLDHSARIYPALFFQPHFGIIHYKLYPDEKGRTVIESAEYDKIRHSPIFKAFKYVKTFTPMRRITTSYAATIRWQIEQRGLLEGREDQKDTIIPDMAMDRVLNRSFMIDPEDRLFKDSVLVRFEDGKTNPRATFTALAAFLDIPYTESMTYCSEKGVHDVETAVGNVIGFDTATVYRTYDQYAAFEERAFVEFCLRDAYKYYGYDFHYYDDGPVDEERLKEWLKGFTQLDNFIETSWRKNVLSGMNLKLRVNGEPIDVGIEQGMSEETKRIIMDGMRVKTHEVRLHVGKLMIDGLYFINKNGQPLRMMPKLELDPALLDQPLYH